MTNAHLDLSALTPESDKGATPSALSQGLSDLEMTAWPYSPVSTCPILQSQRPRGIGGWGAFYVYWDFLVSRRWVAVVIVGLSGIWREGQRQGVEG